MNCNSCNNNYNNGLFNNGQNTMTLQPIVSRRTNVVHRYFVINQPYICENETQFVNHYVKRNQYIPRNICSEVNTYAEENCGCNQGNNNLF